MITCSTIGYNGRLANQMFQFASTVGIARRLGYDVKFPTENFVSGNPHDFNGGKLRECFDIPEEYFLPSVSISSKIQYNYNENGFSFNEDTKILPDNVNLNGYFQSEKYFKDSEKEIRSVFSFRNSILSESSEIVKIEDNSTCVHVRRGDYLKSPEHHPFLGIGYYSRAMDIIGDSTFYVFSDDMDWCVENLKSEDKRIVFLDIENPYVSLNIMSKCSNHIIANSSLSWWAAWIGKKEEQRVISPVNWFGPSLSRNNTKDLYCENWVKI
jgi:hypothetical protein